MKRLGRFFSVGMKTLDFKRWEMCMEMGNLVFEETDAIINPANKYLNHDGGIPSAIVKVGGRIQQDLSNLWISENGDLKPNNEDFRRSTAFTRATEKLYCKYVIHTVGPKWYLKIPVLHKLRLITDDEMESHGLHLTTAITCALRRAEDLGCTSVSSPAISSGIFGFPKDICAKILVESTIEYMESSLDSPIELVKFVAIEEEMYDNFKDVMEKVEKEL